MSSSPSPLAVHALLWICLASAPATAQEERDAPTIGDRPRVAVLLLATGSLEPSTADALSEALIGAVAARGGVTLIGQEELTAQLGRDQGQMLECVSSQTCLGRIGVQLGLAEVVAGTLGRRGDRWTFNLNRVDVRSGEMAGRVFREVEGGLGAVADALTAAVPELYARPETTEPEPPVPPPPAPATLVLVSQAGAEVTLDGVLVGVVGDEPLRQPGIAPGMHEVGVSATEMRSWRRTVRLAPGAELRLEARLAAALRESVHPLVFVGAGVAAGALGAALALGVASQGSLELSRPQRLDGAVTRAEAVEFYAAREREAIAADVLFALAGAAAIGAIVAIFFPERVRPAAAGAEGGARGPLLGARF